MHYTVFDNLFVDIIWSLGSCFPQARYLGGNDIQNNLIQLQQEFSGPLKQLVRWVNGFPDGLVVKNPPANEAGTGSVPDIHSNRLKTWKQKSADESLWKLPS